MKEMSICMLTKINMVWGDNFVTFVTPYNTLTLYYVSRTKFPLGVNIGGIGDDTVHDTFHMNVVNYYQYVRRTYSL